MFIKVSSHKVLNQPVTVWAKTAFRGAIGTHHDFTATVDQNGRPVRPTPNAHVSIDAQWACAYLRSQLRKAFVVNGLKEFLLLRDTTAKTAPRKSVQKQAFRQKRK